MVVVTRVADGGRGGCGLVMFGKQNRGWSAEEEAKVTLACFRAHALYIRTILGYGQGKKKLKLKDSRDLKKTIVIHNIPTVYHIEGGSGSVAVFLALVKLFMKHLHLRLRPRVAVTGILSLCGQVLNVGSVGVKVAGAIKFGAELVLVPSRNRANLERALKESEEAHDDAILASRDTMNADRALKQAE